MYFIHLSPLLRQHQTIRSRWTPVPPRPWSPHQYSTDTGTQTNSCMWSGLPSPGAPCASLTIIVSNPFPSSPPFLNICLKRLFIPHKCCRSWSDRTFCHSSYRDKIRSSPQSGWGFVKFIYANGSNEEIKIDPIRKLFRNMTRATWWKSGACSDGLSVRSLCLTEIHFLCVCV